MCAQPVWFQSPYLESSGMGRHVSVSGSTCRADPMHTPGSLWEFGAQPQWTGSSLGSWAREHPDKPPSREMTPSAECGLLAAGGVWAKNMFWKGQDAFCNIFVLSNCSDLVVD